MLKVITIAEVQNDQRAGVRRLFEADDLLAWNASIGAVLDGTCPGRAWSDASSTGVPRSAFLITPEGAFLAGEPDNPAFHAELRKLITGTIFNPDAYNFSALVMTFSAGWLPYWDAIFPRPAIMEARQHYTCTQVTHDWQAALSPEYSVRRVDAALLDDPAITRPAHVSRWIESNWFKRKHFLAHGFGFATLHGAQIVSWSLADAVSGGRCEIGIRTEPEYRLRGLGAITAAACAEYALTHGYESVGWHCHTTNPGSQRTAQKAGFSHTRDYTHYLCYAREADYLRARDHQKLEQKEPSNSEPH